MRTRLFLILSLAAAALSGPALAQDHAPAGPAAAPAAGEPVIGPNPNPAHPMGGYLKAPPGSTRLTEKVFRDATGLPLYTIDRAECRSQCAVLFPPLTPAPNAVPPSKDWTIRTRDENGHKQWVYKGKPIYTFVQDKPDVHPQADSVLPEIKLARP